MLYQLFSTDLPFETGPYLEIQENHRVATISHAIVENGQRIAGGPDGLATFRTEKRTDQMAIEDRQDHFGIRVSRGLASSEMTLCALPFYLESRDKVSWETLQSTPIEQQAYNALEPEQGLWFQRDLEGLR